MGTINLVKFFSHAFLARRDRPLAGLGMTISDLIWGFQPTPEEAGGGMGGNRRDLMGLSELAAAASRESVQSSLVPGCPPFSRVESELAFRLRFLQALNFQNAMANSAVEWHGLKKTVD